MTTATSRHPQPLAAEPSVGPAVGRAAWRRRHQLSLVGGALLLMLVLLALVGPLLSSHHHATQDHRSILQPPSADHWFGTARLGQDLWALTLRGLQKSLAIGLLVAVFSTGIAALVGSLAGLCGGWLDKALMWVVDSLLILPTVLAAGILFPVLKDRSWLVLIIVIAAFQWMLAARVIRARARLLSERGFVQAARRQGASIPRVVVDHLLPNMAPLLIADATLNVATAVISEAGLSYFGFGVQPPDASLGTLIATGSASAITYPWLFLAPVSALMLLVVAVGLLGEGLRRSLATAEAA